MKVCLTPRAVAAALKLNLILSVAGRRMGEFLLLQFALDFIKEG